MSEVKIPEGYKQTEVGVIPEDWELKMLGEIVQENRISSGLYKDKNSYGSGTSIIKLGDVFSNDVFNPNTVQKVEADEAEIQRYKIKVGDLFIALASVKLEGVGKVMHVTTLEDETIFDHNVALIRTTESINSYFLSYTFKSNYIRSMIASKATQVGTTFLKSSTILQFNIILPTYEEQTAIATALSDVDDLIGSLEKLIAKKEAVKTATMQQLLTGKTRLPEFATHEDGNPKGFKQTELGRIPEDWENKELGEISQINMGQSPKSTSYNKLSIGLPLVQGNADISSRKTIVRNYTSEITKKADKGDLILSVRAPVGEVAVADFDCCIGRGVCSIKFPNNFLYHWLVSFEDKWEKFSKGSTFDSINSNELKIIQLPIPSKKEQTAIATILSDMDSEVQALQKRLDKTHDIKQGMMQQLLTGKVRLVSSTNKGV